MCTADFWCGESALKIETWHYCSLTTNGLPPCPASCFVHTESPTLFRKQLLSVFAFSSHSTWWIVLISSCTSCPSVMTDRCHCSNVKFIALPLLGILSMLTCWPCFPPAYIYRFCFFLSQLIYKSNIKKHLLTFKHLQRKNNNKNNHCGAGL